MMRKLISNLIYGFTIYIILAIFGGICVGYYQKYVIQYDVNNLITNPPLTIQEIGDYISTNFYYHQPDIDRLYNIEQTFQQKHGICRHLGRLACYLLIKNKHEAYTVWSQRYKHAITVTKDPYGFVWVFSNNEYYKTPYKKYYKGVRYFYEVICFGIAFTKGYLRSPKELQWGIVTTPYEFDDWLHERTALRKIPN